MKILTFAAALRRGSYNRKLIGVAAEILRKQRGIKLDFADFREFEMPIYDGDIEESAGIPAGGQEFILRLKLVDALVISTPEYNGGIPGTLKNAIDWVSRVDPIPLDGKPLLLLGASPGSLGAIRGLWHTRVPFEAMGSFVYPEMFGLPKAHQAFDESDNLKDPKIHQRLEVLITGFLQWVEKISKT